MKTADNNGFCSSRRASTGKRRRRADRFWAEAMGSKASRRIVASAGSTMRCTRSLIN
ncbi:hypothetical protein D3C87_2177080 [compost metagenome]